MIYHGVNLLAFYLTIRSGSFLFAILFFAVSVLLLLGKKKHDAAIFMGAAFACLAFGLLSVLIPVIG